MKIIDVKREYEIFNQEMPVKNAIVKGKDFSYRYYKNPSPEKDVTLVFLAGGTGLSDAIFLFYRDLVRKYHLLTFSYPLAFKTNADLADAFAELIKQIGATNIYLMGQSYGGLFSQVMAKRHPELIKGLILSSTCSMYNDLTYSGVENITKLINPKKLKRNLRMDKVLPTKLLIPFLKLAFKKVSTDKNVTHLLSESLSVLKKSITNAYWYHMDLLLGDLMNEFGTHKPEHFESFRNEVMIIFSKEDTIFNEDLNNAFIRLMPQPVVHHMDGGHLALITHFEDYLSKIATFISERN